MFVGKFVLILNGQQEHHFLDSLLVLRKVLEVCSGVAYGLKELAAFYHFYEFLQTELKLKFTLALEESRAVFVTSHQCRLAVFGV